MLEQLRQQVEELLEKLPDDKREEAPQVAKALKEVVAQATDARPDREWYSLSAKGLLQAAGWVGTMATRIGGSLAALGKLFWGDYTLPGPT